MSASACWVCCQVEVPATGRSHVWRGPTECGVSECHLANSTISKAEASPWSRVLLEKLPGSQLVKKFPAFYGNRRVINVFKKVRHLSLSWARTVLSMLLTHFLEIDFDIIFPSTPKSSKWSRYLGFQPKSCIHLLYPPYVLHASPISFVLLRSPK